ncbi:MAG TPA: F0F1 ATP synthase subunit epsilon [Chloroflexota bacterium]|jgi:F-type H+-transporting ATPase subunit epsilon|nr:F0F1 ATP synthase subunit epsilon [Chloroflexota bacterium]
MPLHVEVVAAERSILSGEADEVLADTAKGQVGILPRHAAMLTLLVPGTVRLRRGSEEEILAVGGGFLEVSENNVVVLADSAERAEEIDVARAEEARRRAAERVRGHTPDIDQDRAQAALARSLSRLRAVDVARRRTRGRRSPEGVSESGMVGE